jgi:hypothetical protein
MVFSLVMENTKILANLLVLLVLKFHDPRFYGFRVMNFRSLLSGFAYSLNRSECLVCLTCVHMESYLRDNKISVVLFLSFPKCPIALIVVVEISSYELAKWNDRICPNLGRNIFFVLINLVSYRIILIR